MSARANAPLPAAGAPPALVRLDPATLRLRRGRRGQLQLVTDDLCYLQVTLVQPFPLSRPGAWLQFCDGAGAEIGLVTEAAALDAASRALAAEELRLRYFTPQVSAILDMRDELQGGRSGGVIWEILTDRGPARLHMPNTNEYIQSLGQGRLLLTDRAGNRYEIPDVGQLDAASRNRLGRYIWL